jgi:hypothetical protein
VRGPLGYDPVGKPLPPQTREELTPGERSIAGPLGPSVTGTYYLVWQEHERSPCFGHELPSSGKSVHGCDLAAGLSQTGGHLAVKGEGPYAFESKQDNT